MIVELALIRTIERVLAVLIGGLLVYFGYRLFLAIPDQSADGTAELSLSKDRRLLVTRIGPGTFFALFGTAVLVASFAFPIKWTGPDGEAFSGFGAGAVSPPPASDDIAETLPPRPLSRDEIEMSLAFLTDIEADHAADLTEPDRARAARRFRDAKLSIMGRGWRDEWGDPVEFEIWLNETPPRSDRPDFERALAVLEARE